MAACALYFFTLAAPCALAATYGKRFETVLPLSVFALLLGNYIAGLAGLLPYGARLSLLLSAACLAFALMRVLQKRVAWRMLFGNLFTPAFAAFALLFTLAVVLNVGRAVYHGDEFSHWAYTVKAMAYVGDFGTNAAAASLYASYPPGLSLLQYDLQRLNAMLGGVTYTEWLLFVPYQTTAFALLLSATCEDTTWKNALSTLPLLAVVLALPAVLYPLFYESVFPDPLVGIVAGYLLSRVWRAPHYDALTCATVCAGLAALTLLKDAAVFFSVLCGVVLCTDLQRASKPLRGWTRIGALAAIAAAKASWAMHVGARDVPVRFSETAPLSLLPGIVTGADTSFRHTAFVNYLRAFFEKRVGLGADAFSALGRSMPGWRFSVSFCALLVVLLALLYGAANRGKRYTLENSRRNRIVNTVTLGIFVYWLGLCGLYVLKFVDFEAVSLYCYERYLSIPFLMLITLLLSAFVNMNTGKLRVFGAVLLAAAVLAVAPLHSIYPYLTRRAARGSREMMEPQRAIAARVERVTRPEDRVYLLAQNSDGEGLAQKYLLFPRIMTGGGVGTPMYDGDTWTKDLSAAKWQDILRKDYDYVLISHADETFIDRCGGVFHAPETIEDGALYSVDPDTGMLTMVPDA